MSSVDCAEIDVWIFDLDNTLYPAHASIFPQISSRMTEFIADRFGLAADAARALQKRLFRTYGTTLRGLMVEAGIDPHQFMDYVHAVDLEPLPTNPALAACLAALPGRKLIHTNASEAHARRVMDRLGIAAAFCGIFDIVAADFTPKPDAHGYHRLIDRHRVDPQRAVMVEDMAVNLAPAAALGMGTIWIASSHDWAMAGADAAHIQHRTDDLVTFLTASLERWTGNAGGE